MMKNTEKMSVAETGINTEDVAQLTEQANRCLWFQTTIETKEGLLSLSVFGDPVQADLFELELSRGAAFETKSFMCSSKAQVFELQAIFVQDADFYASVLSRIGWVDEAGQAYPFKIGDRLICKDRQILELGRPLMSGEQVLLLDVEGKIVSQCDASVVYRSIFGDVKERQLPVKRDIITGELVYTRVLKWERQETQGIKKRVA